MAEMRVHEAEQLGYAPERLGCAPERIIYAPTTLLLAGAAAPQCRACVTIPACNEESTLRACLDALAQQIDVGGAALPGDYFEILLLLNNCTDGSVSIAHSWQASHPVVSLHCFELTLPPHRANAGTARRLLLDTAWQRLRNSGTKPVALLCTDADTAVAPDWIAQNMAALEGGADAVGGYIEVSAEDLQSWPVAVRRCYERDRRYGDLVARLEDLLDPQPGDPWPRHPFHFGSSLACTPEAYAKAGGMPEAPVLEDAAFVGRLRQAGLCLRHEPAVRVVTSGRLVGRAEVGVAGQLRIWSELLEETAHCVQSAALLLHRFHTLRCLRLAFRAGSLEGVTFPTMAWFQRASRALGEAGAEHRFLSAIDADSLIGITFAGEREQPINEAIKTLAAAIASITAMNKG